MGDALVLGASSLAGCQQPSPLGLTVGGEPCLMNLHASPRFVLAGSHVTLRRAPGCDKDAARQMTVLFASRNSVQRPIGTATLGPDGTVTGKVVIPTGTHRGRYFLSLDETTECNDTASCAGHPISVGVRVR